MAPRPSRMLAVLLLVAAIGQAGAAPRHTVQIATGDDSSQTRRIVDDLSARLAAAFGPDTVVHHAAAGTGTGTSTGTITIAIGPSALREQLARAGAGVIIAAYTSSQVVRAQLRAASPARAAACTALYAEPAPKDQLRLVSMLFKNPVGIAAILDQAGSPLASDLRVAAAGTGMALKIEALPPEGGLNVALKQVAHLPVLLAVPDSAVFSADTIRNILLTTYRHNQALVGFSADMVKAGALASTYSDIEDINAQLSDMAAAFAASGHLPALQYPRYFHVIVNDAAAKSLGLVVSKAARQLSRPRPQP
jgi:hypothetical protein